MSKKTESRSAYPLSWPDNWPRTSTPTSGAKFRTTINGALENVRAELELFAKDSGKPVADVLISSNVTLSEQRPKDSGVAIYFTWDGLPTCLAVDRYTQIEHNLQAIARVLEAERTKLRHGGLNLVRAAFQGYAKLPPPEAMRSRRPWHEVLEVPMSATYHEAEAAYRRRRVRAHPDRGGSSAEFDEVQRAWDAAKEALRPAGAPGASP